MNKVIEIIMGNERFVLATHLNPDGDAIGSAVALGLVLKALGKDVTVYDRDGVPEAYRFLPETDMVTRELDAGVGDETVLVVLDCNSPERAGLDDAGGFKTTVVIDHHQTGTEFGDIRWVEPREAATGVMVYRLIEALGVEVTPEMAANL
jgi:phosphoesterase RecJ-like protein